MGAAAGPGSATDLLDEERDALVVDGRRDGLRVHASSVGPACFPSASFV
jgi:hypothetical protein